jgi:hypothetical protein
VQKGFRLQLLNYGNGGAIVLPGGGKVGYKNEQVFLVCDKHET